MDAPRRPLLTAALIAASIGLAAGPLVAESPARKGGAHEGRLSFSSGEVEIPAFARKYGVSCNLCHMPFPKLTEFGENFAGNGFQFAVDEPPRDTTRCGSSLRP